MFGISNIEPHVRLVASKKNTLFINLKKLWIKLGVNKYDKVNVNIKIQKGLGHLPNSASIYKDYNYLILNINREQNEATIYIIYHCNDVSILFGD